MSYNPDQERDERGRWGGGSEAAHTFVSGRKGGAAWRAEGAFANRGTPSRTQSVAKNFKAQSAKAMREHAKSLRHDAKNAAAGRATGGRRFPKERMLRTIRAVGRAVDAAHAIFGQMGDDILGGIGL